jgi:hypothetical protein
MMFGYLTLFTALILSVSAAVYSILGLTAIFAAAFWPIVILGGSLEFGKIVTTLWLHKYWKQAELQYKVYLCSAVAILMLLTSMGVFGFLSKAHLDQAVPSGDIQAQVQIFDDKIKTQQDNIKAARAALTQMDSAVDQVMSRSNDEKGADKAVQIRRSQARERTALQNDIAKAQKEITQLQEQRAPIASQARVIEAEVGPIKYIAALVYGDNPEANLLEKAVRWVIILIVIVFDPLALTLLLAATKTFEWERGVNIMSPKRKEPDNEPDDGPLTDDQPDQIKIKSSGFVASNFWPFPKNEVVESLPPADDPVVQKVVENDTNIDDENETPEIKEAMRRWKEANPTNTLKHQRALLDQGKIKELPWIQLLADNQTPTEIKSGFGTKFPDNPSKGDVFVRVDQLPSTLYKFNGNTWIQVDKTLTDHYTYDTAYINHLIDKISSGELDIDLLSEGEREQITHQLQSRTNQ